MPTSIRFASRLPLVELKLMLRLPQFQQPFLDFEKEGLWDFQNLLLRCEDLNRDLISVMTVQTSRGWIKNPRRNEDEYKQGVQNFINFVKQQSPQNIQSNKIRKRKLRGQ